MVERRLVVEPVEPYVEPARRLALEEFVSSYPGFYLLKRPAPRPSYRTNPDQASCEYNTAQLRLNVDPFADRWGVLPIRKREGNPYPDRVSIGRAVNCDLVLRVPVISKVHAHFVRQLDGSLSLRDNQSFNGTFHNGRKLDPASCVLLTVADRVRFGPIPFELVDAARMCEVLRTDL